MQIRGTCFICGQSSVFILDNQFSERFNMYMTKQLVLRMALPQLSEAQREQISSGVHPECYQTADKKMKDEDCGK